MFGSHKKLYAEGAQTEGLVVKLIDDDQNRIWYHVVVRAKFPDGTATEFKSHQLAHSDVGELFEGSVVPVRYDPSDQSKIVLDVPALEASHSQAKAAQQAQLDGQFSHLGEPGAQTAGGPAAQLLAGLGGGGDLKAQLLQMAAQNPGSVIDLRSSQPPAEQASDPIERLAKLADLKERGVLTDAEFAAEKAKILGES
jgi:hypothetical protein